MSESLLAAMAGNLDAGTLNGAMQNPAVSVIDNGGAREVVRCAQCQLVQFRTVSDLCRRCDRPLPRPQLEMTSIAAHDAGDEMTGPPAERIAPVRAAEYRGKTMRNFSLGRRLRELREYKNLTQAQTARKARVPRTYISRIEHCHLLPGLGVVQRLAEALSVGMLDLIPNPSDDAEDTGLPNDPYWNSLVRNFRPLQNDQKAAVLSRVRAMLRQRQVSVA